jgi:hypothetical protein
MYMQVRGSKHNFPKKRYNSISDSFKVSGSVLPLGYKPQNASGSVLPLGYKPQNASGKVLPLGYKPQNAPGSVLPLGYKPQNASGSVLPLGYKPQNASGKVLPLGYKPVYTLNRVLNPVRRIPARTSCVNKRYLNTYENKFKTIFKINYYENKKNKITLFA